MHFKGILSLCGAVVAAVALVSASGATTQAQKGIRIDVSTRAAVVHYLRSIHVNPKGAVIERGARNYAGAHCPGSRWTCASTRHTVVQIAKRGGQNRFVCRNARCAVVQFSGISGGAYIAGRPLQSAAATKTGNTATCIKTTGLGASCSISQLNGSSSAANPTAIVVEGQVAPGQKATGLTQTASYTAQITQSTGSGKNLACVLQETNIDGSTNASGKKGTPITVTLEAHQSIVVKQDSMTGSNTAENATYTPSTGAAGCASSPLSQNQTLSSTVTGTSSITQNEDDQFSACGDGVPGDYANMCLNIEQNQSTGYKCLTPTNCPASGTNTAAFTQTSTQTAIANTPGSVTQTQSSICTNNPNAPPDCQEPGGLVGTVNQDSSGVSTATPTQIEKQCEDAATSGLTACHTAPGDSDFNGSPQLLTQKQYGPVGVGKLRNRHRGRQLYAHEKGLGTATQSGNEGCSPSCDSFTITQTSTQDDDQGGSTQQNFGQADCHTSGDCTATQTTTVNGTPTMTTQSGQDVSTSTTCTGSACMSTTTTAPRIVGNNAANGNGAIQTYNLANGSLVNSFVPDGAATPGANGRAVAVVGNEIFYSELSSDFGASDGIHVAPFNNGAGGSDLRVLPNPSPTTGIQDLAYSGGTLYALTGYPSGTLQAWKLNPTTGSVIAGPIAIAAPDPAADGFTVLPDGNFLINDGDASCTYREYDSATGQATGQSLTVPGAPDSCTGVETDGSSLYFQTNFDSFTITDMSGTLISTTNVAGNLVEDISLG